MKEPTWEQHKFLATCRRVIIIGTETIGITNDGDEVAIHRRIVNNCIANGWLKKVNFEDGRRRIRQEFTVVGEWTVDDGNPFNGDGVERRR